MNFPLHTIFILNDDLPELNWSGVVINREGQSRFSCFPNKSFSTPVSPEYWEIKDCTAISNVFVDDTGDL